MNRSTNVSNLKRNPVKVTQQVDYIFKQAWVKINLSGMHPIGPGFEFGWSQNIKVEVLNISTYLFTFEGAPKLDKYKDSKVIEFIDQ